MGWIERVFGLERPVDTHAHAKLDTMHTHVEEAFSDVNDHISSMHGNFSTLHSSLGQIHADVRQQKEWLKYLHSQQMHIHEKHSGHKAGTQAELAKITSWIGHFQEMGKKQEKHLVKLQQALEQTIRAYDSHLQELTNSLEKVRVQLQHRPAPQVIEQKIDHTALRTGLLQELQAEIASLKEEVHSQVHQSVSSQLEEQHNEQQEAIAAVLEKAREQPVYEPVVETKEVYVPTASHLTNPEQKLLNLLINEADPLSYSKVSQLTGHSINTVRVNMNSLKKKGLIEESTLPSGVKLFSVTNKEKIRKMYNLQVL